MSQWNLKDQFLAEVKKMGGFVNCHAHYDKAFYIDKAGLDKSMIDMEAKWNMSDGIKRSSSEDQIAERISTALDIMGSQGCRLTCTFVDAYEAVGHKAIDAALRVRKEYEGRVKMLLATQPLGGLTNLAAIELYEEITAKADIAGGLPSKDRPNEDRNFDMLFSIAKNLNKPVHVHIDQENNPNERDTEKLIRYTLKYGYEGRVVAVHALSVSAQPKDYRQEIYKQLAAAGIGVIVCPGAALGMRQLDQFLSPVHNSIGNVPEMLEAGVVVGLGTDNIADYYQPFIDGDLWTEVRMLQEACRYYNFDEVVKVATLNGQKLLNIR